MSNPTEFLLYSSQLTLGVRQAESGIFQVIQLTERQTHQEFLAQPTPLVLLQGWGSSLDIQVFEDSLHAKWQNDSAQATLTLALSGSTLHL